MSDYKFRIDVYTPRTLPMKKLAEYLKDLAILMGSETEVHFDRIEEGSAVAVTRVDQPAEQRVSTRLVNVRQSIGPSDALKAFKSLNDRLLDDNAVGGLYRDDAIVLDFPGRRLQRPAKYGPIKRPGRVQGVIIRVGGKDGTVPVHVRDSGTIWLCTATRALARELGPHIFGNPVRLVGEGKWLRNEEGVWEQSDFRIASWEPLDTRPLSEVVTALNQVQGNEWRNVESPLKLLRDHRETNGSAEQ